MYVDSLTIAGLVMALAAGLLFITVTIKASAGGSRNDGRS